MDTQDKMQREIRRIAYEIWDREGRPEGRDREHWDAAKEIWAFRHRDETETAQADDASNASLARPAGRHAESGGHKFRTRSEGTGAPR